MTKILAAARCTACDATATKPDPFFYVWRGRRFWIYRCTQCTHQFVHPPVTEEDQGQMYDDQYFSRDGDWVCGVFDAGYIEAEKQLREEARQVLAMLPPPPGRLLDIGCAGGVFLDEAQQRGFAVAGIELNSTMAQHARTKYSLEVLVSRIEDVPEDSWAASFDIVTLLDCLEHVPQPLSTIKKVSRWLRPGGMVLIRGPLSNSYFSRLKEGLRRAMRVRKQLPGYPLDANTFNKRSLATLLTAGGFEVIRWIGATADFANVVARRTHEG